MEYTINAIELLGRVKIKFNWYVFSNLVVTCYFSLLTVLANLFNKLE